jgi:hypothetical protein
MTGRWSPRKIAGIAVSAMAMLTMAGPALPQDVVGGAGIPILQLKAIVGLNNTGIGNQGAGGVQTFFSFDISWVDPQLGKYYLADRSNKSIDVIDTTTNQLTQFVNTGFAGFTGNNDTSGPDGVLTVHQPDGTTELWVGDTGSTTGQVWVLDANNPGRVLSGFPNPIPIGKGGKTRADELCFNPRDRVIIITSPAEDPPFITFISTATHTVIGYLEFPMATNGLEQCSWSPAIGKFLQPVPEVNGPGNDSAAGAIAVVDTRNMTIDQLLTVPLSACAGPQGTAVGPGFQLMLGCNAAFPAATSTTPAGPRNTAVIDQRNGAVLSVLPNLGGLDEVWFNPGDGNYYLPSCNTACRTVGAGGTEVLARVSSNSLQLVQSVTVAVQNSATTVTSGNPRTIHSVAADPTTLKVFVPIPAVGGNVPQFSPSLCDNFGGVFGVPVIGNPASSATGCIAIIAPNNVNVPNFVQETIGD